VGLMSCRSGRTLLLLVALLVATGTAGFAQAKKQSSPEERARTEVVKLKERLRLTAYQEAKIYTILTKRNFAADSLGYSEGPDGNTRLPPDETAHTASGKQILSLLNAAQRKAYLAWLENH
jgi:hypothetical protein